MSDVFAAIPITPDHIWAVSLVVFRVGAAMAFLPAFGEQVVPMRVKLAATLSFSAILTPIIWPAIEHVNSQREWFALIGPEVASGLVVGFVFRLLVFALQVTGTIAAQSTSLSQFFGGGLGADPQTAFSTLFVVSGLCLAVMLGLHIRVVELLISSYESFPIGVWPGSGPTAEWAITKISTMFGLGFTLAGPFVLASLIYNLGLGAINKAMPQLMVAFVGAPAISFGGLLLLLMSSPIILTVWGRTFIRLTSPVGAGFE
ncbi:flagellar biosynthetic protein FliR [Litoreibacter meonggei]|uniref:Flagellar biosynthetic protein FliR n=1 Tax=Litoreibacter meonggei TaxID=1049199 RepID=A0A497VQG2_9RHOB|nr:flagellar biosynthetic protein FliR [Litoreibacter meonggei]RLJ41184.1 flagellar biosynthetic protein FliR [Litoreibacter meonggei]